MGKTTRGKRDGSGSFSGSFRSKSGLKGRRAAAGIKCPVKKK